MTVVRSQRATTTEEDLNTLEKGIRELKIEFEQFFGGGRRRPPLETQWRVESLIKRHSDRTSAMSYPERFRYSNLASTYAKYQDMWRKKLQQKEEAIEHRHFGAAAKAIQAERARMRAKVQGPFAMTLSDPQEEAEKIRQLYKKLLAAREAAGEKSQAPSFDNFQQFIRTKTQELKETKSCEQVEYRVSVEGGHVKLKATAVR